MSVTETDIVATRYAPPAAAHEFFTGAAAVLAGIGVGFEQHADGATWPP
jgi:hypothetical protein